MEFKHPKYYAELRKQRRLQALKQHAYKPSSSREQEESPQAKGSSLSLSQQAPGSGIPNKVGSAQAPGSRQPG